MSNADAVICCIAIIGAVAGLKAWRDCLTIQATAETAERRVNDAHSRLDKHAAAIRGLQPVTVEKSQEPVAGATHEVCDNGRSVRVRKTRTHYGVDANGKEWPLFIASGRRGYTIRRLP